MQISAKIVDWDCQAQLSKGAWNLTPSQGGCDSFTLFNDSLIFNDEFASLFLRARKKLPPKSAEVLERFLVNVCPWLLTESSFRPDCDLDFPIDWIYSAQSPATVRVRLASLFDINLFECYLLLNEAVTSSDATEQSVIEPSSDVATFLFMWAAAHGQAASKNWGLVVAGG